ncbi:MAG: HAMP domain-containing sensor histidine kinase [Albidovulum sp.]
MRSLRQRAIIGGLVWAVSIFTIGGVALFYFFANLTQRQFDEALIDRYLQVVVALGNSGADGDLLESYLTDPAYQRTYSGRYWQVVGSENTTFASRSLFDTLLPEQTDPSAAPSFWTGPGPESTVRGVHSLVTLDDGSAWAVMVAESVSSLIDEQRQIRRSLLTTLALIGTLGIGIAILQTSAIVRPLNKLREDVAHRWDDAEALVPSDYPSEVAPLVVDINTLLERNRDIVERGRRQAADLAHALKTPSAILRNELNALEAANMDVGEAKMALERVDAQLLRSLARIRAANIGVSVGSQISLSNSVERMARLFRSMPDTQSKTLLIETDASVQVSMDTQDLEEILGNILENAFQWSKECVRISAGSTETGTWITIDDDGPGIPEDDRREALRSGGRLDTSSPGTGLGLAIANDLVHAYGGRISLEHSNELGGLSVKIVIPPKRGLAGISTEGV